MPRDPPPPRRPAPREPLPLRDPPPPRAPLTDPPNTATPPPTSGRREAANPPPWERSDARPRAARDVARKAAAPPPWEGPTRSLPAELPVSPGPTLEPPTTEFEAISPSGGFAPASASLRKPRIPKDSMLIKRTTFKLLVFGLVVTSVGFLVTLGMLLGAQP
ncbi:MAG: hypothetical protein H6739_22610 [Alphaproteobacteria bacterium]|nr:hypothetical protein [Alphaproteobacteria bacterium]